MKPFMKFRCDVCGWVYDEQDGDSTLGIEPGTKFVDLNEEEFKCPLCFVGKDRFSNISKYR